MVEVGERVQGGDILEDGDEENVEHHDEGGGEDAEGEDGLEILEELAIAVVVDLWANP